MISMRRAILVLLVLGIAGGLWYGRSDSSPRDRLASNVISLGEISLECPTGTLIDVGATEPQRRVRVELPFINRGSAEIDLSRFRLSDSCCQGGTLVANTEMVAPNQTGRFQFDVIPSQNPGRATVQILLEYVPRGPWPESQALPRLPVRLSYESQSRGICEWGLKWLDFGDVTAANAHRQQVPFTEQLTETETHSLVVHSDSSEMQVAVGSDSEAKSMLRFHARTFEVEFTLTPLTFGRGQATVVARTPLGERPFLVRWNAIAEFQTSPERLVFLRRGDRSFAQRWQVTNSLNRPFRIAKVSSSLVGLRLDAEPGLATAQTLVATVDPGIMSEQGIISLVIVDQDGREHEERFPCAITPLNEARPHTDAE